MAVNQGIGIPAVSLPNGTNSLPIELLPFFDRFEQIYLWLDADEPGRAAAQKIAKVSALSELKTKSIWQKFSEIETWKQQVLHHWLKTTLRRWAKRRKWRFEERNRYAWLFQIFKDNLW